MTDRRRFIQTSLAAGTALATSPSLFAAGAKEAMHNTQNEVVLELTPGAGNPRNSEGSFITLKDGRILFAYTKFYGESGGDDGHARICGRFSSDGGRTWTTDDVTLVENEGDQNVMSVSLLRLQDGRMALFYLVKNGFHDCRPRLRTSSNECGAWSDPVLCIPAPGYFVVNNDRVIQLTSGRLIVPAAYHRLKGEETHSWQSFDSRGIAMFFLSDDGGQTWREAKTWWALPVAGSSGLQEPGLVELKNGQLYAFCRTSTGRQWELLSEDQGETWSAPRESPFESPNSPLSIERIPATGDLLAIWNDHVAGRYAIPTPEKSGWGRTPLAAAISHDEGQTWQNHRLLEDDPKRGFCYTAIHFHEDTVLLAYCAGGTDGTGVLDLQRLRRIGIGWFYV